MADIYRPRLEKVSINVLRAGTSALIAAIPTIFIGGAINVHEVVNAGVVMAGSGFITDMVGFFMLAASGGDLRQKPPRRSTPTS